jgi:hypothetical protein
MPVSWFHTHFFSVIIMSVLLIRQKLVTCLRVADVNTIVALKVMASYVLIYIFFLL